jgi:hypothetical protein
LARSGSKAARVRGNFGFAYLILIAAAAVFGLTVWSRHLLNPGPTALERLVAENAPTENVQALGLLPDGKLLVGTNLGLIRGKGKLWERLPGSIGNVRAVASLSDGALLVAGDGLGLARYQNGNLKALLKGDVHTVAQDPRDPGHLLAFQAGQGLMESSDGGSTWRKAAEFGADDVLALAAGPGGTLAAGGTQGVLYLSDDAGSSWRTPPPPGGMITALAFDPLQPGRLWITAGGRLLSSVDGGTSWQRAKVNANAADQPLIGLAVGPEERFGVSAGGLLVPVLR